jgi:uncharacterized protein
MDQFIEAIRNPWPWYVAGPLIGVTVPLLLFLGNKNFGISSNLRHVCAICFPSKIPFFQYDWQRERWNLFFAFGILLGGFFAAYFLADGRNILVHPALATELASYGINDFSELYPVEIMGLDDIATLKGFLLLVVGGFLVGFGTRYAGGCTSGHSITGISMLQVPSIIATICFMVGGMVVANFVLPFILQLP